MLLLGPVLDVVLDPLAYLQFGEPLSLVQKRQLKALDDVERFEQLQFLGEVQVRRVAGGIG